MYNGAHLPWGMSLVIMEASLHTDHRVAGDVTEDQVALMTLHCKEGGRERNRVTQKRLMYKTSDVVIVTRQCREHKAVI